MLAPANTELTTPEKSTAKARTNIVAAASHVDRETRVPRQIRAAPAAARVRWDSTRFRREPPKSTIRSIANEPKLENSATTGLPMTSSPTANRAGMTIAVRAARRATPRRRYPSRNRQAADARCDSRPVDSWRPMMAASPVLRVVDSSVG